MKGIVLYTFNKRLWLAIAVSISLFYKIMGNELEVDAQAPASQQPTLETANTGVPIVNITEPTPGGVSHNTFIEYNVGTEGIIFNNNSDQSPDPSSSPTLSELAKEPLFINDNLHGRAAQVILTEVSGVNISKLLGPTEIYGHSSDFIVANPNGIYCNGASFINAHRITLTTGKPQLTHDGVLQALQVDKGTIEIVDKGMSTALIAIPTNPLEILSKAVQIRATIASHDAVHIYTGMNKYDYATKKLTPLNSSATNNNPYVAIDASLLGDIRAKKIILIATEQGAGVNCPNLTAAGDNIEITAAGDIKLKEIRTLGDLLVNSEHGNIEQQAKNTTVYKDCQLQACQGIISLATEKMNITGNGQFSSKQLTIDPITQLWIVEGATSTNATLHLAIQEKLYNHGNIYVPQLKVAPLQQIVNTGQLVTQYDLSIVSQQLINQGTIDAKEGRCDLIGHLAVTNDKVIRGKNGLTLHTKGTLENKGQLLSEHGLEVHANTNNITHTGRLLGKYLKLVTSEALNNQGFLLATKEGIEIEGGDFVNHGKVIGMGKILAKTRSLHHTGAIISKQNSIDLETRGPLTNQGEIYGQEGIKVKSTGGDIIHSGTIKTPGEVEVQAPHIVNTGILASTDNKIKLEASQGIESQQLITGKKSVTVTTQGYMVNKSKLVSEEALIVHATSLSNTGHMYGKLAQNLDIQDTLDNAATINTPGSLVLKASKVTNQGIISAQQQLKLQANSVENKKEINSLQDQVSLHIKGTLTNQLHATIKSKQGMVVEVKEWINQGQIVAEGTLGAKVASTVMNQGVLAAQQNVTIQAQNLENGGAIGSHQGTTKLNIDQGLVNQKNALVSSAQDIEVTANEMTNQGELKSRQNLQATVNNKFTNKGVVTAQQDLTLKAQSFDNFQEISTEKGTIKLAIDRSFTNQQDAFVNSVQDLTIQAAHITNQGDIRSGKSIDLVGEECLANQGSLIANKNLTIQAAKLTNEQTQAIINTGTLHSGQQLDVQSGSSLENKGLMTAGGNNKVIATGKLTNTGTLGSGKDLKVESRTAEVDNAGTIAATHNNELKAQGPITNSGTLSSTQKLSITTQSEFTNTGAIYPTTELSIQAKDISNRGNITAKSATLSLTADQKITNTQQIQSEKGSITLKSEKLVNQSGPIASGNNLTLDTQELTNYTGATLTSGQTLDIKNISQLTNQGTIKTVQFSHTGTPNFTNTETFEIQEGFTLNTQTFTNEGDITLVKGDLYITSQQDITLAKGNMTTQQGNLYLTASKGNLYNTSSILSSGKDMTLEVGKTIDNKQQISTQNNLTIQAHTLTNAGEIQAKTGKATLALEGNLQNTNKIQAAGNVEIQKVSECINTGELKSGATLDIQATKLENKSQGILQAKTVEIAVTDHLLNAHEINGEQELAIQAGRMDNSGKLSTNAKLGITIQQGNLDNTGTISSEKGNATLTVVKGNLTNTNQIQSAGNLTIRVEQALLKNTGQLISAQTLDLKVRTLDNSEKIAGGIKAKLHTTGNLTNSNVLGSAKDIQVTVDGKLKNTGRGRIATVRGRLVLKAYSLHNAGEINFGSGKETMQISDVLEHRGIIKARGELEVNAGTRIENRGKLVAEQNLQLKAPIIQHMSGILQSNQGNLTLIATNRFENRSQLVTFRELIINTQRLENHTNLYSGHDLKLTIPELENTQVIAARGKLTLDLQTLTNRGKIIGGHENNTIEVTKGFTNHGEIAAAGSLTIQGPQVRLENHNQLTANSSLTIYAKNLTNHKLIQGGTTTRLKISEKMSNGGTIASAGDLYITAQELEATTTNPTPVLQANRNINLQLHKLGGNEIKGGEGDTTLTIQRDFTSHHKISSRGNLSITTAQLDNHSDIIAAKTLTIQASQITNQEEACIQGGRNNEETQGENSSPLEIKLESQGDIHNKGKIVSLEDLTLQARREITNKGMVQAGNRLHISAHTVSNAPEKTITSGKDILIQASYITNQEGNIFANQHMNLEGPENQYAEKVSNITGDKQATIKAMRDFTIKANRLENKGKVTREVWETKNYGKYSTGYTYAKSSWTLKARNKRTAYGEYGRAYNCDEYDERDGDTYYCFDDHRKALVCDLNTSPAHINAGGDLHLNITAHIDNQDSQLLAQGIIKIGSRSYETTVDENQQIPYGPYVNNNTYRTSRTLSDAHVYRKEWTDKANVGFLWANNKYTTCYRVLHESEDFVFYAPASTIRAGSDITLHAESLENGKKLPDKDKKIALYKDPLEEIADSKNISTTSSIELPTGNYGIFKLQLDPYAPAPTQPIAVPQVQVNQVDLPILSAPAMAEVDTGLDIFLAELLAPQTPDFEDIREAAERARNTNLATEALDELPTYTSQASTTNTYTTHVPQRPTSSSLPTGTAAADPGAPAYDLPTDPDLAAEDSNLGQLYHGNYQPAPDKEKIELNFLPPLIRSNIIVDQSKFYGSPYFLRHVGLDPGQRGTIGKPLRFLGDPFYESWLINESIRKATARQFLYKEVSTPEEQVKCLIDNTAEVTKDMKVALGIALSKEQINSLKKDILWYVEAEVADQKVLVPQVYLTQQTIDNLRSGKGTGIHSGGTMDLHVKGSLTNTGNISSRDKMTIRAESLSNESFGNAQATIQSTGRAVDLETKKNIDNLSGKISGKTETRVVSVEGTIRNETKLLNDGTLHMQASLESEGNLTMQAKEDIVSKGAKIAANGNASIKSLTGDVKLLTQEAKKEEKTDSRSRKNSWGEKELKSSSTTKRSSEHAVSTLDIVGNLDMEARDLVFMATHVTVGGDADMKASRDFQALAVQDTEETSTHSEEHIEERGILGSKSRSRTNSRYHKKSTSKGPNFNIGGGIKITAKGNADFEGANVKAGAVEMEVQGTTNIRKAYNEETYENSSSEDNKKEALLGLLKNNHDKSNQSRKYNKTRTGNNWNAKRGFKVIGKGDVTTQGIDLTAHTIQIESTEGNIYDRAVDEVHEDYEAENKYKLKQGLLGLKLKGEEGRLALKLRKKKEEKSSVSSKQNTGVSSTFKTRPSNVTKENGETVTLEGSATFKAAKKVVLEATETDIDGKLFLQGKEGVEVIAKKVTEAHEKHQETYTEELSLGVKNSIVAAAFQAKAVEKAAEQLDKANAAHNQYRAQLRQAKKLLEKRKISQTDYDEVAKEEKYHLLAISTATLALATQTKQFLSNAANAVASAGTSLGFSVDLQGDINKTVDQFIQYGEKAKESKIKTKQLEIVTDNTFKVVGSQIHAQESEIMAKDVVVEAFKGAKKSQNIGHSKGGNVTVGLSPTLSINMSANFEAREGKSEGAHHTNSVLNLGKTKLEIAKGVTIQGGQIKTSTVKGTIGGNLHIETLRDTNQGNHNTIGVSMGIGPKPGIGNSTIGGNYSQGSDNAKWSEEQSGFTSTDKFKLDVKNKTKLVGASLGSQKIGKTAFTTKELEKKGIDGYQKSTEWGIGSKVTSSRYTPGDKLKLGGRADYYYNKRNTRQKVTSSVGGGKEAPLTYLDTQSQMKLDSDMVKLVYGLAKKPRKVGKKVVENSKVIYTAVEGISMAAVNSYRNPKVVMGTLNNFQNVFVDLRSITSLAQNEAHTEKTNNATALNE